MTEIRILLCGDNHRDREPIRFLKEKYADYDYRIHCGDSEMTPAELEGFLLVMGNHDIHYDETVPEQRILSLGGHRIYICHGHKDFMRYFKYQTMIENALKNECDVIFFGHVHTYQDTVREGIRLLNPGSLYHNRDGTHPSYMEVTITEDGIQAVRKEYVSPAHRKEKQGFLEKLLNRIAGV